ncbi:MAG TPA: hypothetical protein VL361_29800 [Candidatus Limnocylindrales bacterium]|jgi:hypothetical protein|nr:hypothetical protein [Candidatus Limnocylindrales bacterium]
MSSTKNCSLVIALGFWLAGAALATAQLPRDALEVLRSELKLDRKVLVAEQMKFTESESQAFWPIYDSYRAEVDKVTDHLVELILEFTENYPNISDRRATEMLKQHAKIESDLLSIKKKYIKKLGKVLPASKVFRFAQIDNRQDLATRMSLAVYVPVLPARQLGESPQPR